MRGDPFGLDPAASRVELSDAQRLAWLRLIRSENVGPATFRALINHFGGAERALDRLPDLIRRGGARRHVTICSREAASREMDAAERLGIRLVAIGEEGYPPALRHAPAPPPLLAVRGERGALTRPMVAVVGSRNASAIGRRFAGLMARGLGEAGFVVVSGLARGIDAAAHEASLGTGTVAVLAGGLDRIYPPEHEGLVESLVVSGAAASEMPLGWTPRAQDFPRRNRLIAGMALGVLVVEAAERSGSLITARLGAEFGREVFAVPGHPLDPRAVGTNKLLRGGATLATSVADIVEALGPQVGRALPALHAEDAEDMQAPSAETLLDPPETERARIVSALGPLAVEVDALVRETGAAPALVQLVLLELELAGRLDRQPGNRVALLS